MRQNVPNAIAESPGTTKQEKLNLYVCVLM